MIRELNQGATYEYLGKGSHGTHRHRQGEPVTRLRPAHNLFSSQVNLTEDFWPLEPYTSELTQVIKWVALS